METIPVSSVKVLAVKFKAKNGRISGLPYCLRFAGTNFCRVVLVLYH